MPTNPNRLLRLASLLAVPSLLACGGRLADSADTGSSLPEDAGAPTVNASADAAAANDAAVSCSTFISAIEHGITPYSFSRVSDFLAYFRSLARLDQLVVPAHGVDCSSSAPDGGTCTYDPRQQRLDASDIHYSNDLNQFTGPDGQPWVWMNIGDRNELLAADQVTDPDAYACIVQYNARDH